MESYLRGEANHDDRLTRLGEFASSERERAYRMHQLRSDLLTCRILILIVAVAVIAFSSVDRELFPAGPELNLLTMARWLFFAVSAALTGVLFLRVSPTTIDRIMGAWTVTLVLAVPVTAGCLWPAGHADLRMTSTLAVLVTYTVVPAPLRFQLACGTVFTLGHLVVVGVANPASLPVILADILWMTILNVLGVLMSFRLHTRHRKLYAALRRQFELSSSLQRALGEVRTLRGLIRVCAWCRKVETDADWQQLEAYVRARSDAEFTHGICPTCVSAVTGELDSTQFPEVEDQTPHDPETQITPPATTKQTEQTS